MASFMSIETAHQRYWVSQEVCLDFSIECYGKTQMNILANPIQVQIIPEKDDKVLGGKWWDLKNFQEYYTLFLFLNLN